jgi:mycothiol synthase
MSNVVVNGPGAARRIEVLDEVAPGEVQEVLELLEAAARVDGQLAVSEQGRLQLRRDGREGVRHILLRERDSEGGYVLAGYAQLEETDPVEAPAAELVVHPERRGRGHGRALGTALLEASGKRLRLWAHGGRPAARHLAQIMGLSLFRELRQMRRPLTGLALEEPELPDGVTVRTFRPGEDDAAWLAANAAAFAHHPEQGALTQQDLDDRKAEDWFDPHGFFLAVAEPLDKEATKAGERIVGFHWTKVHAADQLGEVYAVGVVPEAQGSGLGTALTVIGLRHLASAAAMPTAMLYVDADNVPAVTVYERLGFITYETDLMYRTET